MLGVPSGRPASPHEVIVVPLIATLAESPER